MDDASSNHPIEEFMDLLNAKEWQAFIDQHPETHILQTPAWGMLKSHYGWTPKFVKDGEVGAMVLFRSLPLGLKIAYIPRGPIGEPPWQALWQSVDDLCQKERAIFLRVEPDIWSPTSDDFLKINLPNFNQTEHSVQPPRTIMIDLTKSDDDLLMEMKSKTRYNIRLAERKDVIVSASDDVATFYKMMLTTGSRDAFGIHTLDYYQRAYDLFAPLGMCKLLIATYQGNPLAGLMAFAHGNTAWYFYGASNNAERNRMPTYLLQWEAMQWAKEKDCQVYDLWGIPDQPEEALEDSFLDRSDGLWGVYRFKRGFGGDVKRTIGTWDRIYRPMMYKLYQLWAKNRSHNAGS
jgi:lipid II:glycine glycyltransferase (peptidoglycan interpeptide bridge formation enzyme)